ncbi:MAG: PHP-associated domain-containing protein [bacterium]
MVTHRRLKADLHLHTSEDPKDKVRYSARQLIDHASQKGFDVLAITNHDLCTYNDYLRDYAASKGILLIPGIELSVEEKHIVLLNTTNDAPQKIQSLQELRDYKNEDSLVVAPHPYFPMFQALKSKLEEYVDIFDAIEYTHFYFRRINYNKKAQRKAGEFNLPLIGVSDAHLLHQVGLAYSLIDAEKTPQAVIGAIRKKRIHIVTQPMRPTFSNVLLSLKHFVTQGINRWDGLVLGPRNSEGSRLAR